MFKTNTAPQFWFTCIYGLICTSAIFGGEYAGILAGIAYFQFVLISKHREIDWVTRVCVFGLGLSIAATLTLLFVHWDVIRSGVGSPAETLKGVAWFGAAFMMIDAVRFQVEHYKIDIPRFAKWVLAIAIISIPIKVAYGAIFYEIPLDPNGQINDRVVPFLDLNPNYADDVLVAYSVVILWALAALQDRFAENKALVALGLVALVFLTYHFFGANSRAAYLGVFCALLFLSPIFLFRVPKLMAVLLIVAGGVGLFALQDRISSRVEATTQQVQFILQQREQETKLSTGDFQIIATLKNEVLDIYQNTPEGESISSAIAVKCVPRLLHFSKSRQEVLGEEGLAPSFRYLLYRDAAAVLKLNPYLGMGSYDKETVVSKVEGINPCRLAYFSDLHSHYLDIVARGGLFALVMFSLLSLILFYLIWMSRNAGGVLQIAALPVAGYFIYLYVQSLNGVGFHKKAELAAILFSMIILLSINLLRSRSRT